MKFTNHMRLSEPIVKALSYDSYDSAGSDLTATQIIDSPQIKQLRLKYDDEITEDVSDRLWSAFGTAIHLMFENATDETDQHISEERIFYEYEGWKLSGAVDLQVQMPDGTWQLHDYKTTSVWSVIYGKDDWHKQLNVLRWLAEKSKGIEVSGLKIVAVLRDWSRKKSETTSNYPMSPIIEIEIPLWDYEELEVYIHSRVESHKQASINLFMGDPLPACSDEERWLKPTTYAVKKGKNKRAVRVFDNEDEASAFLKKQDSTHYIEERIGEATRCQENYCRVAEFCEQFRSI